MMKIRYLQRKSTRTQKLVIGNLVSMLVISLWHARVHRSLWGPRNLVSVSGESFGSWLLILASCQTQPIFRNTETAIWGPRNLVVETKMLEKWLRGSQLLTLPTFYYAFIQTLDFSGLWLTVSQISFKTFSSKTEPIQNSSVLKWLHWFHWRVHFVNYAHSTQHIWNELDK